MVLPGHRVQDEFFPISHSNVDRVKGAALALLASRLQDHGHPQFLSLCPAEVVKTTAGSSAFLEMLSLDTVSVRCCYEQQEVQSMKMWPRRLGN